MTRTPPARVRRSGATSARRRGFTLLELLVVLVVIGLLAGALVASLGPPADYQLDRERQRIVATMEQLRLAAMLAGTAAAFEGTEHGWRALAYDPLTGRWQPVPDIAAHTLPATVVLAVHSQADTAPQRPGSGERIYFFGSGANTPFRLDLSDSAGQSTLYSDGFNLSFGAPP